MTQDQVTTQLNKIADVLLDAAIDKLSEMLLKALNGDKESWDRVERLIPSSLKIEALLIHEAARLEAMQQDLDDGSDTEVEISRGEVTR